MKLILLLIFFTLSSIFATNLHIDKKRFFGFNKQNAIYNKGNSIHFSYLKEYEIDESNTPYYSIKSKNIQYENLTIEFIGADFSHITGINNSQYNLFIFGNIENSKYFCYDSVIIKNIYYNINLIIKENNNNYEFIFELLPDANIKDISLRINYPLTLIDNNIYSNNFKISKSIAYYENDFSNSFILDYKLNNNLISYNSDIKINSKLIIDPIVLLQGTFFGGAALDRFYDMDVDSSKNIYNSGLTTSTAQIAFNGYQNTKSDGLDAMIVKFDSTGNRLWASYFGGNGEDIAFSTKVMNNNVLVGGRMASDNFIMSQNAHQKELDSLVDGFFANFNSDGTLYYATYFGGEGDDAINGIETDGESIFITGYTSSKNSITSGGYQNKNNGGYDAFLAKFDDTNLDWATYFGGTGDDFANNIVYNNYKIIINGSTNSSDNIGYNGYKNKSSGLYDAFFSEFKLNGSLTRSSYFGSSQNDLSFAVESDGENIYLLGSSSSDNLPTNVFHKELTGKNDGFIAKFKNDSLLFCTYYGGENSDAVYDIKFNNYLYIIGATKSDSNIVYNSSEVRNGDFDAFFLKLDRNLNPIFSTYLGGEGEDVARSIFIDDNINIAGYTSSTNAFNKDAFQDKNNGNTDAFVSQFKDNSNLEMNIKLISFFCSGSELTIQLNKNFIFNNNNEFSVFLSDTNGFFISNNLIYKAKLTDSTFNFKLPSILDYSEKYRIKLVSSSPYFSVISNNFTIYPGITLNLKNNIFCKNDLLKASVKPFPTATYQWFINDTLISKKDYISYDLSNLTPNKAYRLKIIQTSESCVYELHKVFLIKDYPEVELVGNRNICLGNIENYYFTTNSTDKPELIINGGIITSQNSNSFSVEWNNTNSYINIIFKENSEFCGLNQRFDINTFRIDNAIIVGNDTTCIDCIEDYYIDNVYDKYKWAIEGGEFLSSDTLRNIRVKWLSKNGKLSVNYSKNDCSNNAELNLFFLDEPKLNISPNIENVCLNDEVRFITSDAEFLSFTWNVYNVTILENNNNNILIKFDKTNSTTISLIRKNNLNNNIDTLSMILNIIEFKKDIIGLKDSICLNENLIISTSTENNLIINTSSINIISQDDNSMTFYYLDSGYKNLNIKLENKLTNCTFELDTMIYIIDSPKTPEIELNGNRIVANTQFNIWFENGIELENLNSNAISPKINSTYQAIAVNEFGCESLEKSNIIYYNPTSVNTENIIIYPNPNNGEFVVELDKYYNNLKIVVFDLLGNIVFSEFKNGDKLSLNLKLKSGFYFIKIHSESDLIYYNKFNILK